MRIKLTSATLLLASVVVSAQTPSPEVQRLALKTASAFSEGYIGRLPDFTCVRTTEHFLAPSSTKAWRSQATTAYELSYYGRDEHYKLLSVDGVAVKKIPKRSEAGGWLETSGNFAWLLAEILDPKAHPHFEFTGWETVQNRRAMVFSYRIALAESHAAQSACGPTLFVFSSCKRVAYGFHGSLFIDAETFDILRISDTPDDLPNTFALGESSVDYARIRVAGSEYLLPVADHIETWNGRTLFRNESVYSDYRKFVAESTLKPEPEPR